MFNFQVESPLTIGLHMIYADAIDSAGNISSQSGEIIFMVDSLTATSAGKNKDKKNK